MRNEDELFYWKKVKNEKGRTANVSSEGNEVVDVEGRILREKEPVKEKWIEYEKSMNIKSASRAIVTCMGMIGGGRKMHEREVIKRKKVMKAIGNLKNGWDYGRDVKS